MSWTTTAPSRADASISVQVPGRRQHLRTEGGHDLVQSVGAPADRLAGEQVGVDHDGTEVGQHPGDGALA
jgi:hypothetical protein